MVENLNIITSWLPAGQQTDKYSTNPWCLRSKNLDIFSSSKSVKGTAWSEKTETWSDIIKQVGSLVLKTDGKVYENDAVIADPDATMPDTTVSYTGRYGTYNQADRGTSKDIIAQYEWWDWKNFTVFSNDAQYNYNKNGYIFQKTFPADALTNLVREGGVIERWDRPQDDSKWLCQWYMIKKSDNNATRWEVYFNIPTSEFGKIKFSVWAYKYNGRDDDAVPYIESVEYWEWEHYYSPQTNSFVSLRNNLATISYGDTYDIYTPEYIELEANPNNAWTSENSNHYVRITFRLKQKDGRSTYKWEDRLMVNFMWWPDPFRVESMRRDYGDWIVDIYADTFNTYNLLPIKNDRKLKKIWEYYWEKWATTQTLYQYESSRKMNETGYDITDYKLTQYMAWDNPTTMDVVDMISWNERIYMIGDMDWNGYIIPCDLTWWKGTPYIAYWCTFKGAINIDYLMYLVGEDRGISQLWCYNTQELVPLIWGNKKKTGQTVLQYENLIDTEEQYRFTWKMVEYRGDLILTTEDNRVFQYWQTTWGKAWSFILDCEGEITDLKVEGENLIVSYEKEEYDEQEEETVTKKYNIIYQDDNKYKNYQTVREAEYPIAIGNHLLEKEESDLYCSYILPSKDCKLEFWGAWNHYHYRTFKVGEAMPWIDPDLALEQLRTEELKIVWTTGTYHLEYVEDDGVWFTYRLVWDLPQQTESSLKQLAIATVWTWFYTYTEYNHFRKIWEITADEYTEWEQRFTNLNNLLELPKTHTLQVKVRGTWTEKASPELFVVDLVANQRNRW